MTLGTEQCHRRRRRRVISQGDTHIRDTILRLSRSGSWALFLHCACVFAASLLSLSPVVCRGAWRGGGAGGECRRAVITFECVCVREKVSEKGGSLEV